MITLVVLIPILAFVTVLLLALALAAPSPNSLQNRLRQYGYDLASRPAGDLSQPFVQRVIWPIFRNMARGIARLTPVGVIDSSRERLRQARSPMGLGTFLMVRLIVAVGLPGLYMLTALTGGKFGLREVVFAAVLFYGGHRLPDIWLSFRIDSRKERITRALPDALDLIVVCVEAGYSLEAALAKIVETTDGPLSEEFGMALRQISMGRSRREALADLGQRCASADLQTFIAAILQADQMGVSIADVLRVQADAMRVRRRQRAEELIAKAPVKMLFPMTGFIFPALLVVLLGPAVLKVAAIFAGMR